MWHTDRVQTPKFAKHLRILRAETESLMTETDCASAKTILLVEDDDVVRELTAEVLGEFGYRVHALRDGPSALDLLRTSGVEIEETESGLRVARNGVGLRPVAVDTEPFPGFPTDLQAQLMALMCMAQGTSTVRETIFENRFMHVQELARLGAKIDLKGDTAMVTGVKGLTGAQVMATDLRASVSLIIAGLAAQGETMIGRVYHLDRGFERIEEKLRQCGAHIERLSS